MSDAEVKDLPGYGPGAFLRHIPLSLWRMRRVVAEMQAAGAGWGAFAAIALVGGLALICETLARQPGELRRIFDSVSAGENAAVHVATIIAWPVLQAIFVVVILVFVWWGTARLLRRSVTLRQSVVGIAAGGLPQIAFSLLLAILPLPLFVALGLETSARLLEFADYALIVLLFGYGLVAYSAATGLNLGETLAIQLLGAVGFAVIVFGGLSLAGLGTDAGIGWLVRQILVLG